MIIEIMLSILIVLDVFIIIGINNCLCLLPKRNPIKLDIKSVLPRQDAKTLEWVAPKDETEKTAESLLNKLIK
jgi:hypothetical protein